MEYCGNKALAPPAHPLLQIVLMPSAWVLTWIARIFQINVAFCAQGGNKNIKVVGGCVCLCPRSS